MYYTLEELAAYLGSPLEGDLAHSIQGVSDLEHAEQHHLSFCSNPRYQQLLATTKAGVIIVHPDSDRPKGMNFLLHSNPTVAFQRVIALFTGKIQRTGFTGIHESAVIHPTAVLGENVSVGPYAVLDEGVKIGDGAVIGAHVYIGRASSIGENAILHPHVTIREECVLGKRTIIQPGAVIGSCGFGYHTNERGEHCKLEHVGTVIIDDDVDIGANTTIERARFQVTRIGKGTKIGNLVQISHNVEIGSHCILVGKIGIAGSTRIGNWVVLGGKVGVNGHISICDGVRIAAYSGVTKNIKVPGDYGGFPARPLKEQNKNAVLLRNIRTLYERVKKLEASVEV